MEIIAPPERQGGWQALKIEALGPESWRVTGIDQGKARSLTLVRRPDRSWRLLEAGRVWRLAGPADAASPGAGAPDSIEHAPMDGLLLQMAVTAGERVEPGQRLYVLEAMKMQVQVCADAAGRIDTLYCQPGEQIRLGQQILSFRPET